MPPPRLGRVENRAEVLIVLGTGVMHTSDEPPACTCWFRAG